jgi:glycyl-tRNA synthetase beta chain
VSRLLVFEIGTEEIPSAALYAAIVDLKTAASVAMRESRLEYGEVRVYGTPRRLTLEVTELAERQEDRVERMKGPSAKAAFDAEGKPTKAAEGFARGRGVSVTDLVVEEGEAGAYVYAVVERIGVPTAEVLPGLLADLAGGIEWPKSMRWGSGEVRFSRPVRWLLALFGGDVVPVRFGGLVAGRTTRGHRLLEPEPIEIPSAEEYALAMERGRVMLDPEQRARFIREGVAAQAEGHDAVPVVPEKTFAEVVNLVEWPTVAVGSFDDDFLAVPREVLETAMESHQRYFPLEREGKLLPNFVVVHNGDPDRGDTIVAGHERVIRARLADAAFFYREDLEVPDEDRVKSLGGIVFQERLGTLAEKVARIEALTAALAVQASAGAESAAVAKRTAHLAKADLVSHVVVEFPSLQGVMGGYYALASGEEPAVALAIPEHYQPRFAGDALPPSEPGKLVSVADKLDTICGIFAIGSAPTGSADPYGLRRGSLGILGIIVDGGLRLKLADAIGAALDGYRDVLPDMGREGVGDQVRDFVLGRFDGMLRERGHAYDTVAAVLAVAGDDPADAAERCAALTPFRSEPAIADLAVAFTRARNLAKPALGTAADASLMGPQEKSLAEALTAAELASGVALDTARYTAALEVLAALRQPIDAFFDAVLVMDPDESLRDNRLKLLNRFVALFERFADFGRLEG